MNGATLTGSGGGWNTTLSLKANFYDIIKMIQENANRTQPTGFTSDNRYVPVLYICKCLQAHKTNGNCISHFSWVGGMPCSPESYQYGGFGGGGAGCFGGGGGGGFIGGHAGMGEYDNGHGGYSYANPEAVMFVLDAHKEFSPSSGHLDKTQPLPKLWQNEGSGFVHILPPLQDIKCQVRKYVTTRNKYFYFRTN